MNKLEDLQTDHPASSATDVLPDRRRPGRSEFVNPALIPLLRETQAQPDPFADVMTFPSDAYEEPHDLAAAQGILVAVLLSIPLWLMARATVLLILP
jgi:hypothetical protein